MRHGRLCADEFSDPTGYETARPSALDGSGGDPDGMNPLYDLADNDAMTPRRAYYHGHAPTGGIGSTVVVQQAAPGGTYYEYPIYDHRGTVARLTDENGNVTAYYEYNAWGQELREEVVVPTGATNRLRYQSNWIELKDSDGTFYLPPQGRLYDSKIGGFLQRDTRGGVAGSYIFVGNNPLRYVDPTGTTKITSDAVIIGKTIAELRKQAKRYQQASHLRKLAESPEGIGGEAYKQALERIKNKSEVVAAQVHKLVQSGENIAELYELTSKLADVIEGKLSANERATLFGKMSERLIEKTLGRTPLAYVGTKIILGSLNVGTGLGNYIAQGALKAFRVKVCQCCLATKEPHDPEEEWTQRMEGGDMAHCYQSRRGHTYGGTVVPAASTKDKFFAALYKMMTKNVEIAYIRCGD